MITTAILSILLVASSTADASATTSSATTEAATQQPKTAKPKKICKNVDMTGSRIGKRECKTKEQWEQAEYAAELTVKGNAGNPSPQCAMCTQNPGPN